MKAAILVESRCPLVVADVELPNRLEYGQVLVDLHFSGICGAQLNEIDAVKGRDPYLPHILGHEGSGVVIDVGLGVSTTGGTVGSGTVDGCSLVISVFS